MTMETILRMPAKVRHTLLLVLAAVLTWAGTEWVPTLRESDPLLAGLLAVVLTAVLAVITPLVASYGVGAKTADLMGARDPNGE